MQDALVEMSRHSLTRLILKRIGLQTPKPLLRPQQAWSDTMLSGKRIVYNADGPLAKKLLPSLKQHKALLQPLAEAAREGSSASGQNNKVPTANSIYQASLFDATGLTELAHLHQLYSFFHQVMHCFGSYHRVLILIPATDPNGRPELSALSSAIEGFARSLAKECGPRGATVNCIRIPVGRDLLARLEALTQFLLSDHAAFVTGQFFDCSERAAERPIPALAGSLAGKRALVTGAAQGIGYAIAQRLAEEGAHVYCLDRPEQAKALRELAEAIDGEAIEIDLLASDAVNQVADRLQGAPAPLDILIHNAGITRDRTLFSMPEAAWNSVLQLNLELVVKLTGECLHRGHIAEGGRIIAMSSISGLAGNFGQTNYSAAKAGLLGYVRSLSEHLAREGITVNAVAPGFIETSMTASVPFLVKQFARRFSSLGQGGIPDDVAELVCFLSSPAAQGLTGSTIRVCGGNFVGA